jgi:hypothetical protein
VGPRAILDAVVKREKTNEKIKRGRGRRRRESIGKCKIKKKGTSSKSGNVSLTCNTEIAFLHTGKLCTILHFELI